MNLGQYSIYDIDSSIVSLPRLGCFYKQFIHHDYIYITYKTQTIYKYLQQTIYSYLHLTGAPVRTDLPAGIFPWDCVGYSCT